MSAALHLMIIGRVQGVAYRASMQQAAERHGARGWVRNRADGAVEAVIVGTPEVIDAMLRWAGRGPPAARVERIDQRPATAEEAAVSTDSFILRPTV